jgi:hypothetical protein
VQNLHANLPILVARFRILPRFMPCLTCPKPRLHSLLTFMITSPTAAASHRAPNFRKFTFRGFMKSGSRVVIHYSSKYEKTFPDVSLRCPMDLHPASPEGPQWPFTPQDPQPP